MDDAVLERVADAMEAAEFGYHLALTRLVDGVSTWTLEYRDGTPPLEFAEAEDAYAHINHKKRVAQARAAIAAFLSLTRRCAPPSPASGRGES